MNFSRITLMLAFLFVILIPSSLSAEDGSHDIRGYWATEITIDGKRGASCEDPVGFLMEGASVEVRDADDNMLAETTLQSGHIGEGRVCKFRFSFFDVPYSAEYSFHVDLQGSVKATPETISSNNLEAQDWAVDFVLTVPRYLRNLNSPGVTRATSTKTPATRPTEVPTPTAIPPTQVPTPVPSGKQSDGSYLIHGTFILLDDDVLLRGGGCYGTGGYSDIGNGTQVVVRDGNNNLLGVGRLEFSDAMRGVGCEFTFDIAVDKAPFYQISITHRGEMVYTFDDLEGNGWKVDLSLGN